MSRFRLEYDKVSGCNIVKDTKQREYVCTLESAMELLFDMEKEEDKLQAQLQQRDAEVKELKELMLKVEPLLLTCDGLTKPCDICDFKDKLKQYIGGDDE